MRCTGRGILDFICIRQRSRRYLGRIPSRSSSTISGAWERRSQSPCQLGSQLTAPALCCAGRAIKVFLLAAAAQALHRQDLCSLAPQQNPRTDPAPPERCRTTSGAAHLSPTGSRSVPGSGPESLPRDGRVCAVAPAGSEQRLLPASHWPWQKGRAVRSGSGPTGSVISAHWDPGLCFSTPAAPPLAAHSVFHEALLGCEPRQEWPSHVAEEPPALAAPGSWL